MPALRSTLDLLSVFIIPMIIIGFPLYGLYKRVPVYEEFVVGAKEGFQVAVNIIPYLVAILFAVAMFRASGAMDFFVEALRPLLTPLGWPPEVLPMVITRPLTGSGSAGIMLDLIGRYGEDSIIVKTAATMFGSTETTFYVIAVYFGAVNIRKTRHAIPAGQHRHAHSGAVQVEPQAVGERVECRFGGRVDRAVRRRSAAGNRTGEHDVPAVAAHHARQHRQRRVHRGTQVDVDQRVGNAGARELGGLQVADDACVVDEHVSVEIGDDRRERVGIAHIDRMDGDPVVAAHRVERRIVQRQGVHANTQPDELGGDRPTDTARSPGDHGGAVQAHRSLHRRRAS